MTKATVRLLLAIAALLLLASPAAAHSDLKESTPADGTTLTEPPTEVRIVFTGAVNANLPDAVQVFTPDRKRAEQGELQVSEDSTEIVQAVEAVEPGTYAVAYSVTSEDGHAIKGSFVFHIGEKGGDAEDLGKAAGTIDRGQATTFTILRFFQFLFLLTVVGGGIFATMLAPSWPPKMLLAALLGLVLATAAAMVVNSAIVHDSSILSAARPANFDLAIDNPYGSASLVTLALAVLAMGPVAVLRTSARGFSLPSRLALAAVFCGLAATVSLTGHAAVTDPVALRLPMDVVHVIAASIWLGGLVQLFGMSPVAGDHVADIKRFSNTAFASVIVLLVTGMVATVLEVGLSPQELVDTRYGRLILAKLLLYAGTMPLAWMNKSLYVPTIERQPEHATHLLRQYVFRELFLVVAVVALTAWLVGSDPEM